jgi:SAM-dependent methyltransferase
MDDSTARRLNELNRQFYTDFAAPFAGTRRRLQPGVTRLLDEIRPAVSVLDLGCGGGELGRVLQRGGFAGRYLGLDFSAGLLAQASAGLDGRFRFAPADLTGPDWPAAAQPSGWAVVLAFAVLHHIPGRAARLRMLSGVHGLLAPGGRFLLSGWQFLSSPRLAARVQPWERVGLDPADLDPGDYLLDWRSGGVGLRYAHQFDEAELAELADATSFSVERSFLSDGENSRLGLYQVWTSISQSA